MRDAALFRVWTLLLVLHRLPLLRPPLLLDHLSSIGPIYRLMDSEERRHANFVGSFDPTSKWNGDALPLISSASSAPECSLMR